MQVRRFTVPGGIEIVADVGGEAAEQAIILMHGAGESRHVMAPLARTLIAAGRYVVSLDLRGHGDSGRAEDGDYSLDALAGDVLAVAEQLGVRSILCGQRLGGLIAMTIAGEQKAETVEGCIAIDARPDPAERAILRAHQIARDGSSGYGDIEQALEQLTPYRLHLSSKPMLRRVLQQEANGRWYWRYDPALLDEANPRRVDMHRDAPRVIKAVKTIASPSLMLRSGPDALLTASDADRILALNPRIRYREAAPEDEREDWLSAQIIAFLEEVARQPHSSAARGGVDPLTLRQALSCFATGVTVLTAIAPDGTPVGLTANSLCSVSLDPPLILFCIDRRASSLPAFEACQTFAVNILHLGQEPVANLFVCKNRDRFAEAEWEQWKTGAPIIQDALANLECEKYDTVDGGDHRIFIGRVRQVWFDPARPPLLFYQGRYRRVHVSA
ncbi:NADH-FMN oxidoreductase RutF, flavin reductase (DIM6/NTAB) family [Sphingobium faniae]|nr:NADH-FMN oxidoreductase RutF, flavin reductase (DIM6/NTAB) family [Sphingobium faniae]